MAADRRLNAVPDQPRRAVAYVRVSAVMGRGGETFHSPELQATTIAANLAGLKIVKTVEDIDATGTNFNREGIEEIRGLVEAGQVDVVAIYDLSRFGRNVLESLEFIRWLKARNVAIISAVERIDDSPEGQMFLVQMLAYAEYRAKDIGRRWSQIIEMRVKAGLHHGTVPIGYLRCEQTRGLIPHPVEAPAVETAMRSYADGGMVRDIRRDFSVATGRKISTGNLKKLMRNPVYIGRVFLRDSSEGPLDVAGVHQALVDEELWRLVGERMAADRTTPSRVLSPAYSLTGLGRCGSCGGRTNLRKEARGGRRGTALLFCRARWVDDVTDDRCVGCGTLMLEAVEEAVLEQVASYIADLKGDVGAQRARIQKAKRSAVNAESVARHLAQTRAALVRLADGWAHNRISDNTYDDTRKPLLETEEELARQLRGLQSASHAPDSSEMASLAERLLNLWPAMNGAQRNRALREVVDHIVVSRGTRWRQPASERVVVVFR